MPRGKWEDLSRNFEITYYGTNRDFKRGLISLLFNITPSTDPQKEEFIVDIPPRDTQYGRVGSTPGNITAYAPLVACMALTGALIYNQFSPLSR